MRFRNVFRCAALAALVAAPGALWACFIRSPQPVQVWLDHINVEITDQVAVKTYDCAFLNPNPRAVVGGVCYMELEPGARVTGMTVSVDGREATAEILDLKKSNEIFQDIVKNGGSPALLEYYGNQLIQTKVPHIPANGTARVKLRYTMVLEKQGDLVRTQMLNTNPKADMKALKSASVRVAIKSREPIKNVYSPTHPIQIVEEPEWDVVVKWSQEQYLPKHPFVLYYQLAREPFGASLLAHREPGEDGHFMLMLSPTVGKGVDAVAGEQILPKDVVFCVDSSGSMLEGGKWEQARQALKHCVENLRPEDRFNIVDFGTTAHVFRDDALAAATAENRQAALRHIDRMAARGGTAMDEALAASLALLKASDRLKMLLFITDGLPTIGQRDPQAILDNVGKRNVENVRVFSFGVGFDVNTKLLDFLALGHRGEAEYVLPEEKIEAKVGRFYDRVGSPLLTDVQLRMDGLEVRDVFPRTIPDLYKGEQLIVYGRYRGAGPKTLRVTGRARGRLETIEYPLDFPEVSAHEKHSFVPRLWAGQMVDHLLNEIRQSGKEDPELVKEVTALAKRHGILTPYTSFLMAPDVVNQPLAQQAAVFHQRARASGAVLGDANGQLAVNNAWQQARNRRNLQNSGAADGYYTQAADALRQEGQAQTEALAAIRYVGNRTFYNARDVWYDSRFDETKQNLVQRVKLGTKEYFQLITDEPALAKYAAQGDVVIEHKGNWYQFETERRRG